MLFKPSDIQLPDQREPEAGEPKAPDKRISPQVHRTPGGGRGRRWTIDAMKLDTARKCMAGLEEGDTLHIVGANSWNTHDMIEAMAEITGPAELWFCVYSVSDSAVRRLQAMKEAGQITEIHALINHHMARSRPGSASQLHQMAVQMMIYPCHAKVYILRGEKRGITLMSSANLTSCVWLEAATVTDGLELADWGIGWITKALALSEPFTAESMSSSVRAAVLAGKEQLQK